MFYTSGTATAVAGVARELKNPALNNTLADGASWGAATSFYDSPTGNRGTPKAQSSIYVPRRRSAAHCRDRPALPDPRGRRAVRVLDLPGHCPIRDPSENCAISDCTIFYHLPQKRLSEYSADRKEEKTLPPRLTLLRVRALAFFGLDQAGPGSRDRLVEAVAQHFA